MKITDLIERSQSVVEDVLDMALYLRNCPPENIGKYQDAANRLAAFMDEVRAALAVQTQQGVEVKKLEWEKDAGKPIDLYVVAKSLVGWYRISPVGRGAFELRLFCADQFPLFGSMTEAKAAAQSDYESRIRSAIVDVPAVESEPAWWIVTTDMGKVIFHGSDKARAQRVADMHSRTAAPLYAHPPRSSLIQSEEGESMLRLAVAAVLEADTEFRAQMMPGWEGDPLSDEIDGLRRIFNSLSTPPSPYGGDTGDGSATSTTGGDHG